METSLDKLKSILKDKIGLDTDSIGESTLHKILNQRMRHCNIDKLDDYYVFLQTEKTELASLLETAVIPETWFFRDDRPFSIILQTIKKQLLTHPEQKTNILSIPCSTGEEPYSIAMYLLSNGIPDKAFNIHAVDISKQSLEIARAACYGNNSFRGKTSGHYISQYFELENNRYRLSEKVKNLVNFSKVNILHSNELTFSEAFDFILCRNLLIYFDIDTKKLAFSNLNKILKQNGSLFIGHSEFGAVPKELFYTTGSDNAFALIKADRKTGETTHAEKNTTQSDSWKNIITNQLTGNRKIVSTSITKDKKPFSRTSPELAKDTTPPTTTSDELFIKARKLADSGLFSEAEKLCRENIQQHGDNYESFFLLGLIAEASNQYAVAETLLRKALYLNPRHHETLIHLALIAEKNGDIKSADLFKQRASRCKQN